MDQPTVSKTVTVVNPQGLHARPADMFVKLANQFSSAITVAKDDGEAVDGKSILSVLTLGAEQGSDLAMTAVGQDAHEAIQALVDLVQQGFEENDETLNETSDSSTS